MSGIRAFQQLKNMRLSESAKTVVAAAYAESGQITQNDAEAIVEAISALKESWTDEAITERFDEIIAAIASNYEKHGLLDANDLDALTFASTYLKTVESMAVVTLFSTFGYNMDGAIGRRSLSLNPFFDKKENACAETSEKLLMRRIVFFKQISYIMSVFSFAAKARRLLPEIGALCTQFIRKEKKGNE